MICEINQYWIYDWRVWAIPHIETTDSAYLSDQVTNVINFTECVSSMLHTFRTGWVICWSVLGLGVTKLSNLGPIRDQLGLSWTHEWRTWSKLDLCATKLINCRTMNDGTCMWHGHSKISMAYRVHDSSPFKRGAGAREAGALGVFKLPNLVSRT